MSHGRPFLFAARGGCCACARPRRLNRPRAACRRMQSGDIRSTNGLFLYEDDVSPVGVGVPAPDPQTQSGGSGRIAAGFETPLATSRGALTDSGARFNLKGLNKKSALTCLFAFSWNRSSMPRRLEAASFDSSAGCSRASIHRDLSCAAYSGRLAQLQKQEAASELKRSVSISASSPPLSPSMSLCSPFKGP